MQAQVFAADIRSRAGALMGADAKVAGDLTKCSCQLRHFPPFIDKPAYLASPRYRVHPVLEPGCLISLQLISQVTGWVCLHAAAYSVG
jgi:hypothetical protein